MSRTIRGKRHWKWSRLERKCDNCNKDIIIKSGRLLNLKGQGRFCSLRCWGIWQRKNMPKKNTDIEQILRNKLSLAGIEFKEQQSIGKIAVVDFLIKGKFIVQADGDYWHSLPKMKDKDYRQDEELKRQGYIIMRFLGSEIKNNADKCLSKIKESLYNDNSTYQTG